MTNINNLINTNTTSNVHSKNNETIACSSRNTGISTSMNNISYKASPLVYDTIVIGAGAAGLFYAAFDETPGKKLLLEKTSRPGQKLLMSGSGACNITHGGSIKDFIEKYGDKGKKIRSCLYKHNNLEFMSRFEHNGLPLMERVDGKVFPQSMKAKDVLDFLLEKANEYEIRLNSEVVKIIPARNINSESDNILDKTSYILLKDGKKLYYKKLVIATGGASYPGTGSDGTFNSVLSNSLGIEIIPLHPALTPIFVQNYDYSDISGVSIEEVTVSIGKTKVTGPLLFTHKGLSGPAILHSSQYVKTGSVIRINYLPSMTRKAVMQVIKEGQNGNKAAINYISQALGLPKAFVEKLISDKQKKLSTYSNKEMEKLLNNLTDMSYSVSGVGGWNEAMVTSGGVSLDEIDLKAMKIKKCPNIFVIGEALDINGDTGGYNLQFAYSSAMAAAENQ